jgi:chromosome partitioning protein
MIIAVSNRKGGCGKTAVAANLAACYGQGVQCLLIDLDVQADSSAHFGIEESGEDLAAALTGRGSLVSAIRRTPTGVDVAPAGEALGRIADSVHRDALSRALHDIRGLGYAAVVVDCAPGLDPLAAAAWRAADRTVVPVDSPDALRGAAKLRHAWDDLGLDPVRLRLMLTRFDGRRVLDRALADRARELYGSALLASRVRESVAVREAAGWRMPLVLHAPTHWVTDDMRRLAQEVYRG